MDIFVYTLSININMYSKQDNIMGVKVEIKHFHFQRGLKVVGVGSLQCQWNEHLGLHECNFQSFSCNRLYPLDANEQEQ